MTEGIQPRLPSLYEPPGAVGVSGFGSLTNPEVEEGEQGYAEMAFDDPPPARPTTPLQARRSPEPLSPEGSVSFEKSIFYEGLRSPTTRQQVSSDRSLRLRDDPEGVMTKRPPLPATAEPFIRERPQEAEPIRPGVPEIPAATTITVQPPGAAEEGRQPAIEPAIARAGPSPWQTPRPSEPATVVVRPYVTPYVEPEVPAVPGPAETPKPEPAIQVTIGRVEVRAMPAPAPPPQRRRPAAPMMSLEEYLHRRTKGGSE